MNDSAFPCLRIKLQCYAKLILASASWSWHGPNWIFLEKLSLESSNKLNNTTLGVPYQPQTDIFDIASPCGSFEERLRLCNPSNSTDHPQSIPLAAPHASIIEQGELVPPGGGIMGFTTGLVSLKTLACILPDPTFFHLAATVNSKLIQS